MFNISKADRNLSELLRISSFIVTEICEHQFLEEASTIPLSKNQYYILKMLANSTVFNLSDLADILSVSNAAIGKNIDKLVHHKLVIRRFAKADRRSARVSIATKGKDIIEKYHELKISKQAEIFRQYTKKDKEKFAEYLKSFISNTLHEDMDTDILCLQCTGFCGDDCVVEEKKGTCIRKQKLKGTDNGN